MFSSTICAEILISGVLSLQAVVFSALRLNEDPPRDSFYLSEHLLKLEILFLALISRVHVFFQRLYLQYLCYIVIKPM